MDLARRRRRIRNLANLGFLPFGFAMALLESNDARIAAAVLAVIYALAIRLWLLRENRCPECGVLLSTRVLKLGQIQLTVPWVFKASCRRCGWSANDAGDLSLIHI